MTIPEILGLVFLISIPVLLLFIWAMAHFGKRQDAKLDSEFRRCQSLENTYRREEGQ